MLLNLVTKYYLLSTNLPPTKKKQFSRRINQFNTWNLVELQKWLKTAKRIIHNDNLKRKKTLNTIVSTRKFSRHVHKKIPVIVIQIIAKRKLTSITAFFNHIKDNRQHNKTNRISDNIQVKVLQRKLQPSSIKSKQKTNICIHKYFVSNKSQQRI